MAFSFFFKQAWFGPCCVLLRDLSSLAGIRPLAPGSNWCKCPLTLAARPGRRLPEAAVDGAPRWGKAEQPWRSLQFSVCKIEFFLYYQY